MKHQWLRIGSFVLAAAALPFLLSAAITANNPTGSTASSDGSPTGSTVGFDKLISPFDAYVTPVNSAAISDNDTDNLAQIQADLKNPGQLKTLINLRDYDLSFRAAADGRLQHLAVGAQPLVLSKKVSGAANVAKQFLIDYGKLFGLANVNLLAKPTMESDNVGYTHWRYQYVYKNIPVWGSEMLVHLDKNNQVAAASGDILPGININTKPMYSIAKIKTAAVNNGKNQFKMTAPTVVGRPALYIFNRKYLNDKNANKNYLVYKVVVNDGATVQSKILMLNAANGQLIDWLEGLENDIFRKIYNCNGLDDTSSRCYLDTAPEGYDVGRSEGKSDVSNDLVNKCYDDAGKAHDYWQKTFNLDGANNAGGISGPDTIIKVAWLPGSGGGSYYNIAGKWIGISEESAEYARGVLYHEYTHAVYDWQGPTVSGYGRNESGAISEGLSDIFAVATEQLEDNSNYDWHRTERELKTPSIVYGSAPASHYDENFSCGSDFDRHANGLVIGHLAYLLSEGGELESCKIDSIGFDLVQKIFYLALDKYLPSRPDFQKFYAAVNDACKEKYDTDTCAKVKYAMQVADLDHPGRCDDLSGTQRDGEHCDKDGNPITQTSDKDLCIKYGFTCGEVNLFDGATGKYRKINCDCIGCPDDTYQCTNNKCVKCQSKTDAELCADIGYDCGSFIGKDNCGVKKEIKCKPLCTPFPRICREHKCVLPENIKGDGGMYDSSGNPAANGGYYKNITIGAQTLFKNNFNGGTQINTPNIQTAYQKYCWQNNGGKCLQFGGLYQWHTAMGLPERCDREDCTDLIKPLNHQGICPAGFHIPTDGEWSQLEDALKLPDQSCNPNRYNNYDCYNAGSAMRLTGDNDFSAKIFSGIHDQQAITAAYFLSASQVGSFNPQSVYARALQLSTYGDPNDKQAPPSIQSDSATKIGRMATGKNYLFALRCFADCELSDGVWSDWKPIGACGEIKPNIQKQYRSCDNRSCGGQACAGDAVREIPCDPDKSCGGLVKAEGGPRDKYGRDNRALYYNLAAPLPANFSGGGYYATVPVGEACWLADNLNVGTKVINEKQRASAGGVIEKWCYKNDARYCNLLGGIYSWMEASGIYVDYIKERKNFYDPPTFYGSAWLRGICPAGWKLPSDEDWKKLLEANKADNAVSLSLKPVATPIKLDNKYQNGLNTTINPGDGFLTLAWASHAYVGNDQEYAINDPARAMIFGEFSDYKTIGSYRNGIEGLPVRCIKSCEPINGQWSDWQADGECGQYTPYMQRYTRTCSEARCGGKTCEGQASREERCVEPPNCGVVPYEGGPYDASGQTRNQGGYYRTVLVQGTNAAGVTIDQCWLRDNLNVGQLVGVADQRNDSITEKYCRYYYDNSFSYEQAQAICQEFGGLYQWAEAMKLSAKCLDAAPYGICAVKTNHRGICPTGWHMPSDEEWHQLELYYSDVAGNLITCEAERISAQDQGMSDDEWAQTNCAKAGYKLIDRGMSGFDAMTRTFIKADDGFRSRYNYLYYRSKGQDYRMGGYPILPEDEITVFWTTKAPTLQTVVSEDYGVKRIQLDNTQAITRFLIGNYNNGLYRNLRSKRDGLSVRCIKDPCIVIDPSDPNYLVTTHAGQSGVGFGGVNSSGLPYCQPETPSSGATTQPGAALNQGQLTPPSSQGSQLSQAEQIDYLKNLVSQSAVTKPYTDYQLYFLSAPQAFLQQNGFDKAKTLLGGVIAN